MFNLTYLKTYAIIEKGLRLSHNSEGTMLSKKRLKEIGSALVEWNQQERVKEEYSTLECPSGYLVALVETDQPGSRENPQLIRLIQETGISLDDLIQYYKQCEEDLSCGD